MNQQKRNQLKQLLEVLSHSGAVEILKSLKNNIKNSTELIRETKLDKTIVWRRTKELGLTGLIEMELTITQRRPKFKLTPLGERILEILEQIEKNLQIGRLISVLFCGRSKSRNY